MKNVLEPVTEVKHYAGSPWGTREGKSCDSRNDFVVEEGTNGSAVLQHGADMYERRQGLI